MADNTVNTEKYQGTGRIASALGSASLWAIPGTIVGSLMTLPLYKSLATAESYSAVKGKGLAIVGGLIATGTMIYGAVSGWKKAANGKAQFDALNTELNTRESVSNALQQQVVGLNHEVATHRKSFADLHAKHEEHLSHASQHGSRAEHGSHAAAAEHDQAKAAAAEHAM
ncbi:MAG: hypothetical protein ACKVOE_09840 [Rickettsiales bacterium]